MLKERTITLLDSGGHERTHRLRYCLEDRFEIERECGGKGVWDAIYGGLIIDQAAILWGGLKWKAPNLTKERVLKLMSDHAEGGGDIDVVLRHALWCLVENGVIKVKNRDAVMNLMPDPLTENAALEAEGTEGNDGAPGKGDATKPAQGY